MSSIQPGVNSTVSLGGDLFEAAVSVDSTEEKERIDITAFGASVRGYAFGVRAATEINIRTYADPGDLSVGDTVTTDIKIGGASGRTFSGNATVVSYSSSADVDGATTHEIGILY